MPELLGLAFSPWTERARFALDVRRVPYRFRPYQPLLGEPALRLKLRRLRGKVTVPVLTDDDGTVVADSEDIARWGDTHGEGPTLFPAATELEIARAVALSERALEAGRALSLTRVLSDPEAIAELVPRRARGLPLASLLGGIGIRRTLRKYGATGAGEAHRRSLVAALSEIRAWLAISGGGASGRPLLGELTFADIALAQALAFVAPPSSGLRLGRASRRSFTDPALREEFADLVAWRDALYQTFRRPVG